MNADVKSFDRNYTYAWEELRMLQDASLTQRDPVLKSKVTKAVEALREVGEYVKGRNER